MVVSLLLILMAAPQAPAVTGHARDTRGTPLPGVTITVEGTERFTVTDDRGLFTIRDVPGGAVLVASLPGFSNERIHVPAGGRTPLTIVLAVAAVSEAVSVTAPDPPPDTTTATRLTALDVVRTPGAQADLMRALAALPGVTTIDEGAGLFVRGGDVSETRVLLDGVVVKHPYRYETPTGGFRGAVDPFLTSGASFATGGFSAVFANSLSAILDVDVLGRPEERQINATVGLAGISASFASPLGPNAGVRLAANRTTPSLLFAVNPSPQQFDQLPGGWDASASFTTSGARLGALRVTVLSQHDHVGVQLEKDAFIGFLHSATRHHVAAARWMRATGRWLAGISAGEDRYVKSTDVGVLAVDEQETLRSGRVTLSTVGEGWRATAGADAELARTDVIGHVPARGGDLAGISGIADFQIAHDDRRAGVFLSGTREHRAISAEAGVRVDRFHGAAATTLDPRGSVRIALGPRSALKLAAGRYHQAAAPAYFDRTRGAQSLDPMSAIHMVAGYEYGSTRDPLFLRIEAFRKTYDSLPLQDDHDGFSSRGHGRATGVDLYLQRIWPRLELAVSGSAFRARRRWTPAEQRDRYPMPAGEWAPDFAIPHSLQVITKIPVTRVVSVSTSWKRAAGRPFTPVAGAILTSTGYEPVWASINSERLSRYERIDLSISALTPVGKRMAAVFFASVDNVLGRRNSFEMAYSADYTKRRPVVSSAPRAFYVGCSITR